jgi:hypothetical protein
LKSHCTGDPDCEAFPAVKTTTVQIPIIRVHTNLQQGTEVHECAAICAKYRLSEGTPDSVAVCGWLTVLPNGWSEKLEGGQRLPNR